MTRPSDFPPPFSARDFVGEPTDPVDERIEVGVLIVGAGPAGLACAIRLGQLLEGHPDVAERLGEVPVALVGKRPALQDSIFVEVGWKSQPRLALFRAGSFDAAAAAGGEPQVEAVSVEHEPYSLAAKVVDQEQEQASGRRIVTLPPRRPKPVTANREHAQRSKVSGQTNS